MQLAETRWSFSLLGLSRANQFLIEQKYWRKFIEVTTLRICSCDQRTQDKARSRLLGIAFCYRYFPFSFERPLLSSFSTCLNNPGNNYVEFLSNNDVSTVRSLLFVFGKVEKKLEDLYATGSSKTSRDGLVALSFALNLAKLTEGSGRREDADALLIFRSSSNTTWIELGGLKGLIFSSQFRT